MLRSITWSQESEDHIARHGVMPNEVEEVFYGRPRLTVRGRGETTEVYGQTYAGRYMQIVYRIGLTNDVDIVTARQMTTNEQQIFRQKSR